MMMTMMMTTMMMMIANLLIIMMLKTIMLPITMVAVFRIFITIGAVTRSKELHLQLV